MKDKSQSPRKVFSNSNIYVIQSEVIDVRYTTDTKLFSGLMGNYLQ